MRFMFDTDESFSFETLRAVGYTVYGGADIGEVMATAARITPGDRESWHREWRALADRIAGIADDCAAKGHSASAGSAYLRAANYYRTAEFYLRDDPVNDPRVADTSARAIEAFRAAPEVREHWRRVGIPYEGIELSGYYLNVSGDEPGPTLVAHGGFDSTVEEMFFAAGEAARRHGWNCLIFEGPGQGAALRVHQLPFRHDWEAVVTPALDFAVTLPGVDVDRIALLGMSMGGYLAPRAAAFDKRIAACVAYDGVFDFASALPPAAVIDAAIAHPDQVPTSLRWALLNGLWTLGVADIRELADAFAKYDLTTVVDQITCPTLVCEAEQDQFFQGQPQKLYDALRCPKTLLKFTAAEGAEEHCHEGAMTLFHQRLFDWLDETLVG
ncbi:dipeptidyl aminopeptidase [Mycobacterium sp. IEC1808]|uniref:alpha/beta hydrolase family protein n=1 Tax=Mycobacterium sp. IEC1808 TaxID=1743230 RepID=UPI000A16234A|nr:alpha/beta fold hydrolase [Mycobacterium sp. IEC1808]ORW92118.1 dipeptidyl aminopeptidase [Mycobacterium sp. IEC1808]ORW92172.1 dipeptidyl aminopeptidase [Mycobacterium sp. IEC1808]